MTSRQLPLLSHLIAMIQMADDGKNLQGWERARLSEWSALSVGTNKQIIVVHRIGKRLYGADVWQGIADPYKSE